MTTNTIQTVEVITQGLQGPAGISDGDRGDVTVSSNGTSIVIDSDAVTYDKIQDLVTANRVLGGTAAGTVAEVQVTNAMVANDAAIALSKLATGALPTAITVTSANISDLSIVNSDVNGSAAIAGTKISPDFGSQNIVTTGTVNGKVVIAKTDLSVTSNSAGTSALSYNNSTGVFTFTPPDLSSYLTSVAGSALTGTSLASGIVSSSLTSVGSLSSLDVTGNITVGGTVDGRDVATDGSKLDGIDTGAKDDQTAAEIKTLLDSSGLVNSQIDASAAIAGSKISPDFGSQNIYTEGRIDLKDININDTTPSINFNDSDANPDFQLLVNSGVFSFKDATNSADRLVINSDGHVDVTGNLDVGAGVDVTGDISVTGDIKVGTAAGTANQYLKKNSSNELAWETVSPGAAGGANTIHMNDDVKITFGDTGTPDLEIFHNQYNSKIADTGTGSLILSGSAVKIENASEELQAHFDGTGCKFHHGGATNATIETTADGIKIPSGGVLVGSTNIAGFGTHAWAPKSQIQETQGLAVIRNADDVWGGSLHLAKARGSYSSPSAAASGDRSGAVYFEAHDGGDFLNYVAGIEAFIADTVGTNDTPGKLVFSTTADGTNGITEALRLDSSQNATFAGSVQSNGNLVIDNTTDADCVLRFYDAGSDSWMIRQTNNDNAIAFRRNSSDKFKLDSSGNATFEEHIYVKGGGTANKFETTSTGAKVTGDLEVSAAAAGGIDLPNINTWITGGGHGVLQVDATKTYFYGGSAGIQFRNTGNTAGIIDIADNGNTTFAGAVSVASKTVSQTATAVAALEIDCATGNYFTKAISASSTFTFANVPASGTAYGFVIEIDVTGSSTAITWPAAVKWPGGTAPTLTDTKTHVFTFATVDNGTVWRASSLVDYTT